MAPPASIELKPEIAMIEPEREELLSAYLDDEVSSEERALVEHWLAESSELRQLRDEFQAMRTDLQALPRRNVGHDLAATVIRRSISVADADSSSRSAPAVELRSAGESGLGHLVAEWWQRGSHGRRFLWPVLAVAAALAILVFDARQRPEEFEVAKAPDVAPATAESQEQAPFGASAPADQVGSPPTAEMLAPDSAAPLSAPQESDSSLSAPAAQTTARPPAEMRSPASEPNQGRLPKSMRKAEYELGTPANQSGGSEAGSAASSGRGVKSLGQAPEIETIVVPVTAQYLEASSFEKLLKERNIRWRKLPISQDFYAQTGPPTQRAAPLNSLGRSQLQALYLLQADSEQVNETLARVPQADHLMEGNRVRTYTRPQSKVTNPEAGSVQVLLVAPTDATLPAAPAAKSTR